ncbi:hypothetical protein [Nakamurella sp.]|uniref:hypothetical protein n=1 Tax=Nakamurella sp. TaxID=1869182 RepID=UPI003B3BE981
MSDTSAMKLVAQARADARWRTRPIVLLTSGHLSDDDQRTIALGPTSTVAIPFTAAGLQNGIGAAVAAAPSS